MGYYSYPSMGEMVMNSGDSKFKTLDPSKYTMDGVNVMVLGGNMTFTEEQAESQGVIVENFLKLLYEKIDNKSGKPIREDIHILPFVYGRLSENGTGVFTKDSIIAIANKLLLKKCVDSDGNRLEIDKACKGMSETVFFTYCHGALELDKILFTLKNALLEKGYSQEEVKQIFRSTGQVSFAPERGSGATIPSITFNTRFDPTTNNYRNELLKNEGMFKKYEGIEFRYFPEGKFWSNVDQYFGENIAVYSSKFLNAFEDENYEHLISYLKRDENWQVIARNHLGQSNGASDIGGEKKISDNANATSQMMGWALSRLVENGLDNLYSDTHVSRPPFTYLLEELKSIRDDFTEEQLL